MAKIQLNNEQLRLIQTALDFYSRVGMGQFTEIKDHPTFEKNLEDLCRPKKTLNVGDKTPQGEILEIKDGRALINGSVKDGMWNKATEWKDLKDVKLSTDYYKYHKIRDEVDEQLTIARNMLYGEEIGKNGSWGIYNPKVDESCREAYNMLQVIRHEFWKVNPKRSDITVDSSVDSWMKNKIKVELDENSKKELYTYSRDQVHELMCKAFQAGYKKHDVVEAGLEHLDTEVECSWILTRFDSTPIIEM